MSERCAICGCRLTRGQDYAKPTVTGRSHATCHHHVAERFFGRSANRPGTERKPILTNQFPGLEGTTVTFCYECHEELLHNPVLLPNDVKDFETLVTLSHFNEDEKSQSREKIAGRIILLHTVIETGLKHLIEQKGEVEKKV